MASQPNYYDYIAYRNGIRPPVYYGPAYSSMINAQRPSSNQSYMNVASQLLNSIPDKTPLQQYQDRLAEIRLEELNRKYPQSSSGGSFLDSLPDIFGSGASGGIGSWLGGSGSGATGASVGGSGASGASVASGLDLSGLGMGGNSFLSTPAASGSSAAGAGTAAAGTVGAEGGMLSSIGSALPIVGGLAALGYGGYNLSKRNKWDDKNEWGYGAKNGALAGAGAGAAIGSVVPVVGTGIGALVGGAVGGLGGLIGAQLGGGKGRDQIQRDTIRRSMKDSGLIDDAYNLTLADGSKYDIGKDGSIKNYNVDFSRAGIGDTVAALNPLSMIVNQGDTGKRRSDLTGYYTNAATSGGDTKANIQNFYAQAGLDHDKAYGLVHQMQQEGRISKEDGDQAKNALDQAYGVGAYAPGGRAYVAPKQQANNIKPAGRPANVTSEQWDKLKPYLKRGK